MATRYATAALPGVPTILSNRAGEVICTASTYDIAGQVPVNADTIVLGYLPAKHALVRAWVSTDALTAGIDVDVGLAGGTGVEIFETLTLATAADVQATVAGVARLKNLTDEDVAIQMLVNTTTTETTGAFTFFYEVRPLNYGE